ncbi:MAG: response regulator [Parcubacteria group bacterium]|nr:response regulator [Parcubacteria group bacterium]
MGLGAITGYLKKFLGFEQARDVLIVEDDLSYKIMLERILRSIDPRLKIKWTTTAEAAKAVFQKEHYALVIADFALEGDGTGLDLWKALRERHPTVPFILISGYASAGPAKTASGYATDLPFLTKPFPAMRCRQMIESALEVRS